jgi:hypothetical protein
MRYSNGWAAIRKDWTGVLGMYWRVPPPLPPRTFYPPSWKPLVSGKSYPNLITQQQRKPPRA